MQNDLLIPNSNNNILRECTDTILCKFKFGFHAFAMTLHFVI